MPNVFIWYEEGDVDVKNDIEAHPEEQLSFEDPQFYAKCFSWAVAERRKQYLREGDNFKRVCVEEYDELSKRLDATKIQESPSVRNVLKTRRLANLLIDDQGEVNLSALPRVSLFLARMFYSLGPNRQHDALRNKQILKVLSLLQENKELVRMLKSMDRPLSNKHAEGIIRDTLQIPASVTLTDAHTRRAVLSAWMCTLRQNVGSCFATAPAIIIHDEQPAQFLKDIKELLTTGRLKRTFGGIEYSVPMSASWGAGDLKKPFLIPLDEEGFEESKIWTSPGLEAALEAAEVLNPDDDLETRFKIIKQNILNGVDSLGSRKQFAITSAEELLRKILLAQSQLTEKDIEEYENRPKNMVHSGLLMVGNVGRPGGKGALCAQFLARLSAAFTAFKGLADNALLKSWEFTVASFAETKAQFTRWNLYSSLGLGPNEHGGIGACLFGIIKEMLDKANERVKEIQYEYEQVFHQLKGLESRMRSASSERDGQWIKIEYQTKRNEFNSLEEIRDQNHYKAHRLANLFDLLIEHYDALFPKYFQEVYDADMHDITAGPYDDSPAGFRLLYKYGRSNTSQWTRIKTPDEFIDSLSSFFTSTEIELVNSNAFEGLENEISTLITAVVNHVKTQEFLESAFHRMAAAHQTRAIKNPLDHLDKIDKKPWAYTSGGTMGTLVSCYFKLENKPAEVERWVESPIELLVFFIDTLKHIPPKSLEAFLRNPDKSMLIHSPTHAFLLKPGKELLKRGWTTDAFTYTWVRDQIVLPGQKFVENIWLHEEMIHELMQQLSIQVPKNFRHYFLKLEQRFHGSLRPYDFRNILIDEIQRERGLKHAGRVILSEEQVDSVLYEQLPFFPRTELRERLELLYSDIPQIEPSKREEILKIFDQLSGGYSLKTVISASALQEIAKGLLILESKETTSEIDFHFLIASIAQQMGFALPKPIIFADTNWVKEYFAFVTNPGSGKFELWRTDALGIVGAPMVHWEEWLNGTRQDRTWGIYTKPYEYNGLEVPSQIFHKMMDHKLK